MTGLVGGFRLRFLTAVINADDEDDETRHACLHVVRIRLVCLRCVLSEQLMEVLVGVQLVALRKRLISKSLKLIWKVVQLFEVARNQADTRGSSLSWWSSRIQMEGMILSRNRKIGGENLQNNQKKVSHRGKP